MNAVSDRRGGCRLLGPQHRPQRPGVAARPTCAGSATATSPARAAWSASSRRIQVTAGPRRRARRRRGRGGGDRHAAGDARGDRASAASRRAATCWSRSRWRTPTRPGCGWCDAGGGARRRPALRPHVLLHARGPGDPRPRGRRASSGDLLYYDSVRVNLGLVQQEIDVFWDLAPHDISIVDFILGSGREPVTVTAQGADPLGIGHACVGYLTLRFGDGLLAHCHLNWLSPTKIRTTIVGGSERMVRLERPAPGPAGERLRVGRRPRARPTSRAASSGAGRCPTGSAAWWRRRCASARRCAGCCEDWAGAIRTGRAPMTDGHAGLRVLRVLEAAQASLREGAAGRAAARRSRWWRRDRRRATQQRGPAPRPDRAARAAARRDPRRLEPHPARRARS